MPVGRFFLPSFLPVGRSGGLSIGGGPARPDRREPAGPGRGPRGRGPGRRRRRRFPGCCLREGRALVAGSRAGPTAERRERAGRLTASGAGPAVAAGDQDSARARTKPAREPGPGAPGGRCCSTGLPGSPRPSCRAPRGRVNRWRGPWRGGSATGWSLSSPLPQSPPRSPRLLSVP